MNPSTKTSLDSAGRNLVIEDDRTGLTVEILKRALADNLFYTQGKFPAIATKNDFYMALAYTVRDRQLHRWIKVVTENITKVLYPNDEAVQGKQLRLEQQYFFVSCSLQDMIRMHLRTGGSLNNFHEAFAVQLNDTHPSIGVAELMRLLVDEHQMDWDLAWDITRKTFAYTNHTLLPEALEKWPINLFGSLLPRHLEIIYEITAAFWTRSALGIPMTRRGLSECR